MMKISKCKKELARIISENGGWRDGEFAAQDGDGLVGGYGLKPEWNSLVKYWWHEASGGWFMGWFLANKIKNHHQTVLSRAEYFHFYPAPDAGGWIEWGGGECPVERESLVDYKLLSGAVCANGDAAGNLIWRHGEAGTSSIIAYRLHKPEQAEPEFCESVMRSIPEPIAKPTIDQLLQDWRNADDLAKRKRAEADEAAAMRDERWEAAQARAGEMGVAVCVRDSRDDEPKLAITDWRDLQIGDEIIIDYVDDYTYWKKNLEGKISTIVADGVRFPICATNESCQNGESWFLGAPIKIKWRFIRRP